MRQPDPAPQHHWSGWPGAYCLRCGAEDRRELCVADGHDTECDRPECVNTPCVGEIVARFEEAVAMTWFGDSWLAPLNEECEYQQTPAGEPCLRCEEPIESWASGVVQTCFTTNGASRRPQHLECFVRGIIGSAGHLQRRCSCYGGNEEDPAGLTMREAARYAVLVFIQQERGEQ